MGTDWGFIRVFYNTVVDVVSFWIDQLTLPGFVVIVVVFLASVLSYIVSRGQGWKKRQQEIARIKILHKHVFICIASEELKPHRYQLHGNPHGTDARPGMKIIDPKGQEHIIKEVYNSDEENDPSLEKSDSVLRNGEAGTIVIESPLFNLKDLRQQLWQSHAVALRFGKR